MKFTISEKLTESWYTPEKENDDGPNPPSFLLSPLTGLDSLVLRDMLLINAHNQKDIPIKAKRFQRDVLEFLVDKGLRGWKDMPLIDGAQPVFNDGNMSANLGVLTADAIELLAYEIYYRSVLTDEDKKKS